MTISVSCSRGVKFYAPTTLVKRFLHPYSKYLMPDASINTPFIRNIGGSQIRLYNQDCLTGMRQYVETGSVDVLVTSPPYNIGKKYHTYDDTIDRAQYLDWLEQ